jgi:transmembrane sensor
MQKNYEFYSAEQLLDDAFFIEWIKYQTPEAEHFWTSLVNSNPDNLNAIKEAELQLRAFFSAQRIEADSADAAEVWEKIGQAVSTEEGKIISLKPIRRRWLAAASVAILLLLGGLFWMTNRRGSNSNTNMVIATTYGQLKTVTLPDASQVVLNANSIIRFKKNWDTEQQREVWLEGDAFFDVKHVNQQPNDVKPAERFLVHTNDLTVEVLGTSFNIRKRRGKTEVVLQTGRIKVSFNNGLQPDIIMSPGDVVSFDSVAKNLTRTKTIPENYSAWKEKKLILQNPTVEQIIIYLEDNFGKKILLEDQTIALKKIEGPILLDNLNDALFVLSTVLNVDIIRTDSTLFFKNKQPTP